MQFKSIIYALKTFLTKIHLGNDLKIHGIQALSTSTKIHATAGGKISISKVTTLENVHLSSVEGSLEIGKGVFFNRNCIVVSRGRITIGDDCIFGPNVIIYDHDHLFNSNGIEKLKYGVEEIVIGKGCWIGAGVIILKGTHIGDGCVIAAGSVIKGDVPGKTIITMHQDLHYHIIK